MVNQFVYALLSVLFLSTIVPVSVCSYQAVLKQYNVEPLPDNGPDVMLRTDLNDGLECVYPTDCYDVKQCGGTKSRVYRVFPLGVGDGFLVFCDMKSEHGGWLVFQRRQDGSVDFYRNWENYRNGFGNLLGEFWLGLEKIHLLTAQRRYKLLLNLGSYDNGTRHARYNRFYISDEDQSFQLLLGSYTGTAGDSMSEHNGFKFSTVDKDNDHQLITNCAVEFRGAWWYNRCYRANLNALYSPVVNKAKVYSKSANSNKPLQFTELK